MHILCTLPCTKMHAQQSRVVKCFAMASGINFYSYIAISLIRISDIAI